MQKVVVSILVPSYNRPEFLKESVESVLKQDGNAFEIIVSDDCSPRGGEIASLLDNYKLDSRIKVFYQKQNLGEAKNREFLMSNAAGEFLFILGDDDILEFGAISKMLSYISANNKVDLFLFGYAVIDEFGLFKDRRRISRCIKINYQSKKEVFDLLASDMFPFWFYHPASFLIRSDVCRRVKSNSTIGIGDDILYLFDCFNLMISALIVPDYILRYRKFSSSSDYSQQNLSKLAHANIFSRILVFRHLVARSDLQKHLTDVVSSPRFKKRFVINSILSDVNRESIDLADLGFSSDEVKLVDIMFKRGSVKFYRIKNISINIFRFAYYSKLGVISYVARVFWVRVVYIVLRRLKTLNF
jgi:glycosyltransferase involved in cell wall biosynthesis